MGSIDWLTTIIGIAFFGAVESNPFISTLANTNLLAFSVLKLAATLAIACLFYQAEKKLSNSRNNEGRSLKRGVGLLRLLQGISLLFLAFATLNNLHIILQ